MRTAAVAIACLALGGFAGYLLHRPEPAIPVQRRAVAGSIETRAEHRCEEERPLEAKARELRADPVVLQDRIEELKRLAGTEEGAKLAALLGEVRDPAVEAAAMELARQGQVVGFDLLDRLNIENPETRRFLLQVLRTETRAELLGAAIHALHRNVPTPSERREAAEALLPASLHADAEVRRRAVIALADWGATDAAVQALRDPSVDVRAGAAYALGRSRAGLDALAERVADEREDWAVREQAWKAMRGFALDDRAHAVWTRFRDKRDAMGEVR